MISCMWHDGDICLNAFTFGVKKTHLIFLKDSHMHKNNFWTWTLWLENVILECEAGTSAIVNGEGDWNMIIDFSLQKLHDMWLPQHATHYITKWIYRVISKNAYVSMSYDIALLESDLAIVLEHWCTPIIHALLMTFFTKTSCVIDKTRADLCGKPTTIGPGVSF